MKLIKGVLLVVLVLFIATIGVCQATENSATPELKRISYSRDGSVRSGFSQSGEYWVSRDAGTTWKKEPKPQDMGEILVLAAATAIFSWLGWLGIKSLYYKVTGKEPEEPYYESTPGGFQ